MLETLRAQLHTETLVGSPLYLGVHLGKRHVSLGGQTPEPEAGEAAVTGHVSTSRPSQARPRVPAPSSPGLLQAR